MSKRSPNPYIDDRAFVDPDGERDDSSDEEDDSTDAQIRREDRRRYNMPEIVRTHADRLRSDAPYRIPTQLLQGGAATPARNEEDIPEMLSRAPSPAATWNAPADMGSRAPTPAFDVDMAPPPPPPLFLADPDSRGPTPFVDRGETPTFFPPLPRIEFPRRQETPFPTPYMGRGETAKSPALLPRIDFSTYEDTPLSLGAHLPLLHAPSDTPSERPAKKRRLDREMGAKAASKRVRAFLDIAADEEDEEEGQGNDEEEEEEEEETRSDIDFLDDREREEDDEPIYRRPPLSEREDDTDLQALATHYEHVSAQYTHDAARERRLPHFSDPEDDALDAVKEAVSAATAGPTSAGVLRELAAGISVVPGSWVRPTFGPSRGNIAFVLDLKKLYVWQPAPTSKCIEVSVSKNMTQDKYRSVIPTPDDLAPFVESPHRSFRTMIWTLLAPALAEGDRVVVVRGDHKDDNGVIVVLREVNGVAWAKILPKYDGVSPVKKNHKGVYVRLADVRRHVLDAPYQMRLDDRVCVVSGALYRGLSGRVSEIHDNGVLSVEVDNNVDVVGTSPSQRFPNLKIFQVEMREVQRSFAVGDIVQVQRGGGKGNFGLIVALHVGGSVELLVPPSTTSQETSLTVRGADVDFAEGLSVLNAGMGSYTQTSVVGQQSRAIEEEEVYAPKLPKNAPKPPPQLAKEINASMEWHAAQVQRKAGSTAIGQGVVASIEQLQAKRRAVEKSLMEVGLRYRDIPVFVGGSYIHKGFDGTVENDHDSAERAKRLEVERANGVLRRLDQEGIVLTIKNRQGQRINVDIKHVWHKLSKHKLTHAILHLTRDQLLGREEVLDRDEGNNGPWMKEEIKARESTPPPPASSNDLSWGLPETPLPELAGEASGEWMCIPSLAGKRVDVKVEGVSKLPGRVSDTILRLEGRIGRLLLAAPISITEKKVDVFGVGKNGTKHAIDRSCVKPLREDDGGRSLTEIEERVVIVGPDRDGNPMYKGLYGRTRPHLAHSSPAGHLSVQMLGHGAPVVFPISSLCLSANIKLVAVHGTFDVTNFE